MPVNTKIDRQGRYIKGKEAICLMNDQASHFYKKIEPGSLINTDIIKQEIDQDIDKIDINGKINQYHDFIVNKADGTIIS